MLRSGQLIYGSENFDNRALVLTDVKQIMCHNLDLNYEIEITDSIVYLGECKSTTSGFKTLNCRVLTLGEGIRNVLINSSSVVVFSAEHHVLARQVFY